MKILFVSLCGFALSFSAVAQEADHRSPKRVPPPEVSATAGRPRGGNQKTESPTLYPGIIPAETAIIRAAFAGADHGEPEAKMVYAKYEPAICDQTRRHAQFLADQQFTGPLPASHAHLGDGARSATLIGTVRGNGKVKGPDGGAAGAPNQFEEIVSESYPGMTEAEAAKTCITQWHQSPGHKDTLQRPGYAYCISMVRATNQRWYCVGIKLSAS